jgi:hypothetical protein
MRFLARLTSRALTLRLTTAVALAALAALVAAGALLSFRPSQAAHAATTRAAAGTLAPVAVADPLHPTTTQDTSAGAPLPRGARPTRPSHAANTRAAPRGGSVASAVTTQSSVLLSNFNGVSSHDSAVTNFGLEFEPPDQGLCVGNGFVVEPVNSAFTIYRTNGSVVTGPFNVNVLYSEGNIQFTSDPRCYFDPTTNTWFAIILFLNKHGTSSHTDLAVNTSGDPTTPWTDYQILTTDDGTHGQPNNPGCPCFGDQPLLGIDGQNIYISTNEFSILGPQFNGAQIYAVSKADLVAKHPSVHFVHFANLTIGGAQAASVQPAITTGPADAEYFLSSLDPNGTGDTHLGVWAMTNRDAVAAGGVPTLSRIVISSEAYSIPPGAVQQGSTSLLDTGDDRMQQAQFIDGALWGALDTAFGSTPVSALAWFKVVPHLQGQTIGSATLAAQGYLSSAGNYLLYPAIQVDATGNAGMVFTISGPTLFPSAAYALRPSGQASFGAITTAASGTGPYSPSSTRWGDYSWAILDPTHDSFWFATEYIPPLASQTVDGRQNWGTRVLEVSAS